MKIIFFGLGSIGRRHAELLKKYYSHDVFAFRSNKCSKRNDLNIPEIYDWYKVKELKPEIAFITNPTSVHVETAIKCANLGMHLFIEKPLCDKMKGIEELQRLCLKKNLTCYIAYCLRFHPVIKEIKKLIKDKMIYHSRIVCSSYLPDWRKDGDFRKSYSANSKLGGGVLLDMSHEFDYIEYLFGDIKEIRANLDRASDITIDVEDVADALIKMDKFNINLHIDFLSQQTERKIKVDFEGGYIVGDLMESKIQYFENEKLKNLQLDVDKNGFYKEQLDYFFLNINNKSIMNSLKKAKLLLKKILELKKH